MRLRQLLEGSKQYRVPLYQRPYSWTTKQLERLWRDIKELADTRGGAPTATHFTGSLVLSMGDINPSASEFLVVDGQQRLTSLSLLICALRDHLREVEADNPAKWERLHESYIIDKYKSGDARLKLLPTQADRHSYRGVVDGQHDFTDAPGLLNAYRFFRTRIRAADDPDDPNDIDLIESAVLDGLSFVAITASHDDNVYRIFESLNNTGLRLTQGDLLRNYIFMRLGADGDDIYDSTWLPMQKRLSSTDLEVLFWIDMTWNMPEAKQGDIYELQQARMSALTPEEVAEEVARFNKLSSLLARMRNPELESHPGVRHRLARLAEYGMASTDPLVLRLLELRRLGQVSSNDVERSLAVLESFLVRRLLVNAPHNALSRILMRASGELDTADVAGSLHKYLSTGRKFYATDAQVRDAVIEKPFYFSGKPQQRKTVLAWLEDAIAGKEPANLAKTSIEHIMPQSLSPEWADALSVDLGAFGSVEELHEAYVHTLANLTLTGYNPELSNRPFDEKRRLLADSHIELNKQVAKNPRWGREQILERGRALADLIAQTWIPPLDMAETVESGIAWSRAVEAISAIPAGRWASYGDVAALVGTHPVPLGSFLGSHDVPNVWRVLKADGTVGYPAAKVPGQSGLSPVELLRQEGLEFDDHGRALPSRRIGPVDLGALIGIELTDEAIGDSSELDPNPFLDQVGSRFAPSTVHGILEMFDYWTQLGGTVEFGSSTDIGAFLMTPRQTGDGPKNIWPWVVYSYGAVEVVFQHLANRPPFDSEAIRRQMLVRLNEIRGIEIPEDKLTGRPSFSVDVLADARAAAGIRRPRLVRREGLPRPAQQRGG